MWAAAEGHSNLGIPESVGKEFVRADAAGKPDLGDLNDHETAEAIRDGELASPQKFGDFWLFDLRVTGTGVAYRDSIDEYAIRDPKVWLSEEFVERCNGLPVIFGHPERSGLNAQEFADRAIGTIVLPYLKDDEVRGVAKIFDKDSALLMQTTHRSTSPGVTPPKGSEPIVLEDGTKVLAEGLPLILDHLAVCEAGVWDKDGPPDGIRLDALSRKDASVTEEEKKKLEEERDDAKRRADAAEKELKDMRADAARKDAEEEERRKDAAKKDAEESEKKAMEAAEKEKADKAKKDARKDRHAKHDGEIMDCSRCDSEEEAERKDGAKVENVDPDRGVTIHDSKRLADLEAELARIKAAQKPLTMDDRNEIAKIHLRYDSLCQMLGDQAPLHMPGETPIAYRRRCADSVRKHTENFKTYVIHDALDLTAFGLMEEAIIREATAAAKNPKGDDGALVLREVRTTENGKQVSRFFGDSRAAWAPFQPPVRHLLKQIAVPQKGT